MREDNMTIYATQLSRHGQEIKYETKSYYIDAYKIVKCFEVYANGNLIGSMTYSERPHAIYIKRMDNLTIIKDEKDLVTDDKDKIDHIGNLCMEHALRESLKLGKRGRIELDAVGDSPIAYFKFGFRKVSKIAVEISDTFFAMHILQEFNITAEKTKKEKLCNDIRVALSFNLQIWRESVAVKAEFNKNFDRLISVDNEQELEMIRNNIFQTIEDRLKIVETAYLNYKGICDSLYTVLINTLRENMHLDESALIEVSIQEALQQGSLSPYNETFEKWLNEIHKENLSKDEFKTRYREQVSNLNLQNSMYMTPKAIDKKIEQLNINKDDPFPEVDTSESIHGKSEQLSVNYNRSH